jgi:ubiquinone/menaquinone biosynthesis C-methylase UbiE
LRRAGIGGGMRVLDIGCGVGEVSLIAARLVGPSGHVTGIDLDPGALDIARGRATRESHRNLSFEQRNCDAIAGGRYDAVMGRHILLHSPDPLHIVRCAAAAVRPGGVVAFQEFDFSAITAGSPVLPLNVKVKSWFYETFKRAGLPADVGAQLFGLMREAGLDHPQCRVEAVVDGGPDSVAYEWIAESIRSIVEKVVALGVASAEEVDIDTLESRLRDECVAAGGGVAHPLMYSAFARKPA